MALALVTILVTAKLTSAAPSPALRGDVAILLASGQSTSLAPPDAISPGPAARYTLTTEGTLRFLSAAPGTHFLSASSGSASIEDVGRSFLRERATAFGINSSSVTFATKRSHARPEHSVVRYDQVYAGIPVFGSDVIVQLDAQGGVESVTSDILRDTAPLEDGRVPLRPALSAEDATAAARAQVVASSPRATDAVFSAPVLTIYAPSVLDLAGDPQLVWRIRVDSADEPQVAADLMVDAGTGAIAHRFTRFYEAIDREVYDANNTTAEPGTLERDEGDPASGIDQVDKAYDFLGDTYNFYNSEHGRDGIDNAGGTLSATVRRCTATDCPWGNAAYSGGRMRFGDGYALDDVTGHELTHGVTGYESGLVYENTSGAINESFSDVWGEFIDLTNGKGNDAASVRWDMGEELPGGAIRSMEDPPSHNDPDRLGSPLYKAPVAVPSDANDQGYVHTNSGINNKLCYLLTDGDTFNNHTITGMGISPVADLYYEVQTNLLGSSPDWTDFANAMQQAAVNLSWSQSQKDNLLCALIAVELVEDNTDPDITCPSDAQVECSATGGTPKDDPQLTAFFAGVSASDVCGVTITNDAPALFPDGETTVTFTATDASNNQSTCQAKVTVVDTTKPTVACPADATVECSTNGGTPKDDPQLTAFFAGFSASDVCDDDLLLGNDAPDVFPVGETIVTFTAQDDAGNVGSCTAKVTVEDTTPPTITVDLSRYHLWPPNHKMADIAANVTVTDVCDPNPTFVLVSITSDEPINGTGDGDAEPDWDGAAYGTSDVDFRLRSERAGTGDGRIYTILYRAIDASGNTADATAEVCVPHDRGGLACASDGYQADGAAVASDAQQIAVVLMSYRSDPDEEQVVTIDNIITVDDMLKPRPLDLDVTSVDPARAAIGNLAGATYPLRSYLADVNADGQKDLALFYRGDKVRNLLAAANTETGPVGLHFSTRDATGQYLIRDILTLGAPVASTGKVDGERASRPGTPGQLRPDASSTPNAPSLPAVTRLTGILPNPFQGSTTVSLDISTVRVVRVAIYSPQGSLVRTLASGMQPAGRLTLSWNGRDNAGSQMPSGVYLVRVEAGDYRTERKAILLH